MELDLWKTLVKRLDDRFGDYLLTVKCPKCGHHRTMMPIALANVVGWDRDIAEVMLKMRCQVCGTRGAIWEVEKVPRIRGRGIR